MALIDQPLLDGATDRWLSLVAAVEDLSAAESLEDVIATVRDAARAISGADGVTFVLRDGDLCHYVEENAIGPLWKGRRFPMTACISGWCMLNGRNAVIPDIYADPRIPHDAYRPTFVKSLVMTPVRAEDPLAAIGAYWNVCRAFEPAEVALLEGLARSTAAAIASVQAREDLRESEARLRLALSAGGLTAWELDLDRDEFTTSPLFRETLGLTGARPLGYADLMGVLHPEDVARQAEAMARARASRGDFQIEVRTVGQAGVRWIEMRGRVLCDEAGEPRRMTGVALDVTDRKQAKERISTLQAELAHVGRLTELGEMSSAFAHELNQPLAAANNYLSAARRLLDGADPALEKALTAITKADDQFLRASQIIQRIRGFIGRGEFAPEPEDVRAMVEEAAEIALVDPRRRQVGLKLDMAPDLPGALADKVQVQQVLLNLIRNAFEALEGRKTMTVVVGARAVDGGRAVELCVEDDGPGLAPEVAARLFEPFVTTKATGMGVGLSICRQIVEAHGGRLWLDSPDPGEGGATGARFCFTIPAADAA